MNKTKRFRVMLASPRIRLGDIEYNTHMACEAVAAAKDADVNFLAFPHDIFCGASYGTLMEHALIERGRQAFTEKLSQTAMENGIGVSVCLTINGVYRELFLGNSVNLQMPYLLKRLLSNNTIQGATAVSDMAIRNELREASLSGGVAYAVAPGAGESSSFNVYDGYRALAFGGKILAESKPFSFEPLIVDISGENSVNCDTSECLHEEEFISSNPVRRGIECKRLLRMQAEALKRRAEHIGAKGFIIGVSGGLDSALAIIAAVNACALMGRDPKNCVLGVSMPGFGTTPRTRANAEKLVEGLGAQFLEIDIKNACKVHFNAIGMHGDYDDYSHSERLVFENVQARERTQILLSLSNRDNLLDVGTGDLSESALGFTTFGGDHLAQYGVNASLPKTVIRTLVEHAAETMENAREVLTDILATPVSPELLPPERGNEPAQRTEEILGAYELHDMFLLNIIWRGSSPSQVYALALEKFEYEEEYIYNTLGVFLRRFFSQQFKRNCSTESPNLLYSISPAHFTMTSDMSPGEFLRDYEQIKRQRKQL